MGISQEEWDQLQKRQQTRQAALNEAIAPPAAAKAKYRNTRVLVDLGPDGEIVNGHLRIVYEFQSKHEAQTYHELVLRRQAGEIRDLRLQEPFALQARKPDGTPGFVGEWISDFVFTTQPDGERHIVDAKGVRTAMYLLKKKIVEACYSVRIEEV